MSKIRVLIIDDHTVLRQSIAKVLGAEPDLSMMHCGSVGEGLLIVGSGSADLVILDLDLGTERGTDFMEIARRNGFQGPVLVLTAGVPDADKEALSRLGISGVMMKDASIQTLAERIREAMGAPPVPKPGLPPAALGQRLQTKPLTPRESQVLRLVVQGLSNKEIAGELYCSETNVKAVLQQLFRRTGTHSRSQLVGLALIHHRHEL